MSEEMENFYKSLQVLETHFSEQKNYTITETAGLMQLFNITLETARKVLKSKGIEGRQQIQKAKQLGYLTNTDIWLQMIDDRNKTSHEYEEKNVDDILKMLPIFINEFKNLAKSLKNQ